MSLTVNSLDEAEFYTSESQGLRTVSTPLIQKTADTAMPAIKAANDVQESERNLGAKKGESTKIWEQVRTAEKASSQLEEDELTNQALEDSYVESLFGQMDKLLSNPNADHAQVLEMAYMIVIVLMRRSSVIDKQYSLDKEPVIHLHLHQLKNCHNGGWVLAFQVVAGSLLIASGLIGISNILPGTSMGQSLANASPRLAQFATINKEFSSSISVLSTAVGNVGQGFGTFSKIPEESQSGAKTQCQFWLDEHQRLRREQTDSAKQHADQQRQAAHSRQEVLRATHDSRHKMTSGG